MGYPLEDSSKMEDAKNYITNILKMEGYKLNSGELFVVFKEAGGEMSDFKGALEELTSEGKIKSDADGNIMTVEDYQREKSQTNDKEEIITIKLYLNLIEYNTKKMKDNIILYSRNNDFKNFQQKINLIDEYFKEMMDSDKSKKAKEYLTSRKLNEQDIKRYGVSFIDSNVEDFQKLPFLQVV